MLNLINMSENYNIYTYDFNSSIYSGKHNFTPPTSIGILNIPTNSASDKYLPIETTHVKHELLRTKTKLLPETKQSYEDLCQSISQYNIKYSKTSCTDTNTNTILYSSISTSEGYISDTKNNFENIKNSPLSNMDYSPSTEKNNNKLSMNKEYSIKKSSFNKNISKYKEFKNQNKESYTLDNKHRQMVNYFQNKRKNINNILDQLNDINNKLNILYKKERFTSQDIKYKAELLDKKDEFEYEYNNINSNNDEMDYYDIAGDLIIDYYDIRDNTNYQIKEPKNILDFLADKKTNNNNINNTNNTNINKVKLLEKYCQRVDGIRINQDNGSQRIKYCEECNIEKILDMTESAYICPCCGDSEVIIFDEDRQIKDYSPYRRLNHFREWLNQFQAKQSPDIPEQVFIDIVKELNKNRVTDLSILNKKYMKTILKKLQYNIYYEHVAYIINKLNNLPPPKITRDMEKLFISMFFKIQEPWENYKSRERKNFLSYSYVLHKLCELLELDHLLECFPLHKDSDKIMENDQIWKKICNHLKWQYISSFK
jgi:predicted RNA-binding Zn-ribbon protein involved in translation (DUF1610 family)